MNKEDGFKNRFRTFLSRLTPEKVVGVGGLAVFGATAVLAYDPSGGAGPALALWLGNLGLNVLAGIVNQAYDNLRQGPGLAEEERLKQLAQTLEQKVAHDVQLQTEIGALLNETNALAIAEEVVKDNPAVHGWLIFRIAQDVQQYRGDFDQLHQAIAELKELVAAGQGADHEAALKIYLETVARQTARLPLSPLDPSGRESTQIALHQVFISLNAGESINASTNRKDRIWVSRSVLSHLYFNTQVIILGDPGSGKSTLLRYLTFLLAKSQSDVDGNWARHLSWIELGFALDEKLGSITSEFSKLQSSNNKRETRQLFWLEPLPLPVLLNLRDLAAAGFDPTSPTAIWDFFVGELDKQDLSVALAALQRKAQAGEVIFLLDGVDEVPIEQRPPIWQAVKALDLGVYGGNRWVATCRVLSFHQDEAAKADICTIEPFDEAQIDDFIDRWYASLHTLSELSQDKAAAMAQQLKAAARREGLRPLAQNPMLLTIMALVQTYYGTLPDERAKLYQQCVETLLLRWQRHKEVEQAEELPGVLAQLGTTQENLERLLWEIGWQAHSQQAERDAAADIPENQVMQIARKYLDGSYGKAEQFVEYTERWAHLLIGRGGQSERMFTFPHRTFQEYLAACFLASQRRFGREASKLAAESDSWREVLNLAAGTLVFNQKNREKAVDGINDVCPEQMPATKDSAGWRRVWLAGEMAAVVGLSALEMDEVGKELLPRLQRMLSALLDTGQLTTQQRAEAGTALAVLGDPRPGVCSKEPLMLPVITVPEPFALRENDEKVTLVPFAIAKYPVTNAQYHFFAEDGGYSDKWRDCWSEEGWRWKEREGWVKPRFWQNGEFNKANQPVVGISWYEAEAFCRWLTQTAEGSYRLPTEAEWERAAGHTDRRKFPWGDEWQMDQANSSEARLDRTSAVGMFPAGQAVCGAADLVGNVWEWTNSWFDKDKEWRVLRGGSWDGSQHVARVGIRNWHSPRSWSSSFGFRVVSPVGSGS
ncbi:MAG: SUMF1/EgtB/PvdO family nonheme iron enzyme [Anaerolineaceae bacterium]|nr:SUMF1/EgtB/PvdO family nonheme iron enzyme [Anaerolineaceae bacterium]